jgi:hypothetical protein
VFPGSVGVIRLAYILSLLAFRHVVCCAGGPTSMVPEDTGSMAKSASRGMDENTYNIGEIPI